MNYLIAGGTGFIGRHLIASLPNDHQIAVIGRDKEHARQIFPDRIQVHSWQDLPNLDSRAFDIIVNLSGYNISASRWSPGVKKEIIDSRVHTNTSLINWLKTQGHKPRYYSASAIGIYGLQEDGESTAFDENTPIDFIHPKDFLSEVGIRWEQSLQPAIDFGIPVTITRFGVVLKRGEGILRKLLPSFKLGLGSIIGTGKQVISWVYLEDVLLAFRFVFLHHELTGAFNLTSPHPVSQGEFSSILANVLHKPLLLKTPAFAMRLLFGEMGENLLNHGTRVLPKRLSQEGFSFSYPDLKPALERELVTES